MRCLDGGLPDLGNKFGGPNVIGDFQRANSRNDLFDLGSAVSASGGRGTSSVMSVADLDLEVLAETDIISYAIKACGEQEFSGWITRKDTGYRPLSERTLSTS